MCGSGRAIEAILKIVGMSTTVAMSTTTMLTMGIGAVPTVLLGL